MNTNQFTEAWNKAFFPEGKYQEGHLEVEIKLILPAGEQVSFHARATPRTNINQLARAYSKSAVTIIGQPEAKEQKQEEVQTQEEKTHHDEVLAIEHILYRNNEYIVKHFKKDGAEQFAINNILSNADIGVNTPVGKGVLKKFRNGAFKDWGEEENV